MSLTLDELIRTASMAYLSKEDAEMLIEPCVNIMRQIDTLKDVDVQDMERLNHPVAASAFLREDTNVAFSALDALAETAPKFADALYWVPQVVKE